MCTLLDARSALIASSCAQNFLIMPTQNHCVRQRKNVLKKRNADCRSVYISINNITIYVYMYIYIYICSFGIVWVVWKV